MPILFTSQSGGKTNSKAGGSKQERIERLYSFTIERRIGSESNVDVDAHALTPSIVMKVLEQTSFDLDKKIWDSGIGLSSWIVGFLGTNEPLNPQLSRLYDTLFSAKTKRIVELGTGTGMVSLVLSTARAALLSEEANVAGIVATDLPSALPLLEHNIELNRSCFARRPPLSMALDWDEDLPQDILDAGRLDLIVMADVTYNTASFPSLIKTLLNLLKLGLDHDDSATPNTSDLELAATPPRPPLILLGYKQRDEGERSLWEMAKENGVSFGLIGKREGAGGEPVEIWLGEYKV
ncbi:hypothetical protein ONZ45_g16238 [Pleurotus djamor]|nr:hypothetical protein ONZ45_g16238 [Pleurotus djamor]